MKQLQHYGWEYETVDERPSEFVPSSGYATLSGYPSEVQSRRAARARAGLWRLALGCLAVLALGSLALWELASMLRS
ncbi:MAG: hypothetical protein ABIP61_03815 [Burkholderiaceae bacterium]